MRGEHGALRKVDLRPLASAGFLCVAMTATTLSACAERAPGERSAAAGDGAQPGAGALAAEMSRRPKVEYLNVSDDDRCTECRIELVREVVLGTAEGPGIIEDELGSRAIRDERGRYYLIGNYSRYIKVYSARGAYLTTIGRAGEGPGEYSGIGVIRPVSGDTLYVFDQPLSRYTVLGPSYEVVRTARLAIPPYIELVIVNDSQMVFNSPVHTPDRIGLPLHLLNMQGEVIRSFGSTTGAFSLEVPSADSRAVARAGPDRVWSAYRNQYAVELWDTAGNLLRVIRRNVDWFPPQLKRVERGATPAAPRPGLMDIRQDARGRLWVLTTVADEEWREAVKPGGPHGEQVTDWKRYRDIVIEVLDPVQGRLLASRRAPEEFGGRFVDDERVGGVFTEADGTPFFGVWRLRLVQP